MQLGPWCPASCYRSPRTGPRGHGSGSKATPRQLQRNLATNPADVTPWCPYATRGHDTQVPMTRSASARALSSGDKDKATSPRYGPNLTERWGRRSRRSCQRPHTEFIAILPGRESLPSRMRTRNFEVAGEAILEMGRERLFWKWAGSQICRHRSGREGD